MSVKRGCTRALFFLLPRVCIINLQDVRASSRVTCALGIIGISKISFLGRGAVMAKRKKKTVTGRVLHDPVKDKLRPIFPLDLSKCRTVDELGRAMGDTAFTGRQIGDAADVLETMARDRDCFVVLTLAGALTVGKMGLIFCDLIESGIVKAIVSTGALMAHGLVEATGLSHFRYDPSKMDDKELFGAGYNRVYDSLEPETNLDHVEEVVDH